MRIRLPEHYTILITRAGHQPIALQFRPWPVVLALGILASLPIAWVASLVYSNGQLSQRNQSLTETANEVLTELDSLNAEVQDLQERAGLPNGEPSPPPAQIESQGGIAGEVEAETLFSLAQSRLPRLSSQIQSEVRPALEETLAEEEAREEAFPSAKPIRGEVEVSSEFGLRPNPFSGRSYEFHNGIDFRGAIGTPIYATAKGVVVKAVQSGGYGKHVVIDHGYGYETLYAHLSKIDVEVGDRVQRGKVIGALGNTGRSSGPHLHYSIYRKGQAVNPRYYLRFDQDP
ncbi:M23 family metallopeptidase [Leptolyngbya sp. PCC 6406]|uniref:M23 family metallopeptidase n=1 Tax=Leptolyngbya sp. PCC 6406 TaxID=1173264 RepID=UPI0002ABFE27|nr:M23 family metallopeptidase [Leptolyngbya sp. PCC 6406]